jgi:hypothetical protein
MDRALQLFRDRLKIEAKSLEFHQWCIENIYLRGKPFSFEEHMELETIYKDMHPDKRFLKGVQVGATTYAILLMLWLAIKRQSKSIYLGPSNTFIRKFTPDRVDPIIDSSPQIKNKIKDKDDPFLKKIGFSSMYFLGAESAANVASVDADFEVVDETDIINQERKEEAKDRLEHSPLAMYFSMSKPTIPGFGIDEEFEESDQHYRLMKCPSCGTYNNVVLNIKEAEDVLAFVRVLKRRGGDIYYFACEKCEKPLDPRQAEWVAKFPNREVRGYQLSQVYWTRKPARYQNVPHKLYEAWHKAKNQDMKKRFWRSLLGVAYGGDDQPITEELLNQVQGDHALVPGWTGISFMGIDQGDNLHLSIAHPLPMGYGLVFHWFEIIDDFDDLNKFMRKHNVAYAVIDAMPNKHPAKKFVLKHKKKASIQYFKGQEKEGEEEKGGKKVDKIHVDRTESLDDMVDCFKASIMIIPGIAAGKVILIVRKHLKKLVKEKVVRASGIVELVYKTNVENHFAMSMNNAWIAYNIWLRKRPYASGLLPAGGSWH